ncbi:uncharacterized protein CDAR_467001 [Caerostris darwini]|uniref:Uncharacterized protein n=1 Tax=Caerostris darwini TaxID=1538125 RepID=A0AAV4T8U1_9ARAC|nr:uncharacterized protein CDAR_467001 [Caerostris darwini]
MPKALRAARPPWTPPSNLRSLRRLTASAAAPLAVHDSYLVDSASSHMLVSKIKPCMSKNNWRASLVPAAAVIPAPIAYIKVVVVKKLVVEPWAWLAGPPHRVYWSGRAFPSVEPHALHWVWRGNRTFTLKKLECSRQAYARIH